jgi:flagellar motor component MotA
MSSTKTGRKFLLIIGKILLLLIVLIGVLQSGIPASYFDTYRFLFVFVGGVALVLISFPGTEIWRAFRHAAGGSGSDAEISNSAHLWEAAGRGFWILGGLGSVLSMMIGFTSMRTVQFTSMSVLISMLIRTLLSTFYGGLLAVICFVPCWKLLGIAHDRPSAPDTMRNETPRSGWRFGTVLGYVLFLAALISTSHTLSQLELWPVFTVFRPPLLVVLGGTLALILFIGGNNTRLTASTAFAGMGLIGSLMGFIQMLVGMTDPSPQGIGLVAGAIAFIIVSCLTALLGMAVIGGPLEDRAIRTGKMDTPSAFSRVSWYVFPLLSLIFMVLVFNMIILPLPKG